MYHNALHDWGIITVWGDSEIVDWIYVGATIGVAIACCIYPGRLLNGICGVIISHFEKPVWNRHRLVTGMALIIACAAVFILTRQPYAGIICLAILVVKGLVMAKGKSLL